MASRGSAIRETLAALGLIASMVFVGLEIRQNTVASRAAAYQAIGIATAAAFDSEAHDRQFLMTGRYKGAAAMDTIDWLQAATKMSVFARLGETLLLQVEDKILPPDAMERLGYLGWQRIFEDPTDACVWPLIRPQVSASFRQFVEEGRDPNAIDCSGFAIPPTL